jgi:exosortase/archaeosortase
VLLPHYVTCSERAVLSFPSYSVLCYLQLCHSVTWFQNVLNARLKVIHWLCLRNYVSGSFRNFAVFFFLVGMLGLMTDYYSHRKQLSLVLSAWGQVLFSPVRTLSPPPYFLSLPPALRDSVVLWSTSGHVTQHLHLKALIVTCSVWWLLYAFFQFVSIHPEQKIGHVIESCFLPAAVSACLVSSSTPSNGFRSNLEADIGLYTLSVGYIL